MATSPVISEEQDQIWLDEPLQPVHFEDEPALLQTERLGWAIGSAIKEAKRLGDARSRGQVRTSR
jgi:hypothetical protein